MPKEYKNHKIWYHICWYKVKCLMTNGKSNKNLFAQIFEIFCKKICCNWRTQEKHFVCTPYLGKVWNSPMQKIYLYMSWILITFVDILEISSRKNYSPQKELNACIYTNNKRHWKREKRLKNTQHNKTEFKLIIETFRWTFLRNSKFHNNQ